jgi:hypothetical protein
MKKITSIFAAVALSLSLVNAQYSDLVSLGSLGWNIDPNASTGGIFSQTSSSVSFNSAVSSGDAVQGSLVSTPVNWSSFNSGNGSQGSSTDFAINMSFTGVTNPNMGFNIQVWSSDFNKNLYFAGSTASATSTASFIPLTFDSGDTSVLANPGVVIVSWNDGGTPNVTMNSLAAVPEPSTYALMALGGLALFFIARRRKAKA